MQTIDFYIKTAKERAKISSDRKLSAMLLLPSNAVSGYKNKGVLPSDETMVRLARIAHISPEQALMDLNIWRSEGQSKVFYSKIAKMIEKAAVTTAAVALMASPAFVSNTNNVSHQTSASIYYGK